MFLAPDGDEIEIASAAADFLSDTMPVDRLHQGGGPDLSPALRRQLGDMGWFALAVPEALGGSGLGPVEHALFFREIGRQCGPADILAQCLAAQACDDAPLRARLLAGEAGVALAVRDGAGLRIVGAADAAYAVEVDRSGARLFALAGAAEERPALDPVNSMRIAADAGAPVVEAAGETVWRMGMLGTAAMLVGLAEAALAQIVEYAKVRETFGRKIGAYQAVRHPCVDMALRVEAARCQLWFAAAALAEDRADAGLHLDAVKHLANQAAHRNADTNIQLHGGIGVTDEHHAHLYLKHALLLAKLFGTKRGLLPRLLAAGADC